MNETLLFKIVFESLEEVLSIPKQEMNKDLELSKYLGEKKKIEKMALVIQRIEDEINAQIDALNIYQNVDIILDLFLDSFNTPNTLATKIKETLSKESTFLFQNYFGVDAIYKVYEFWIKWYLGIFGVKFNEVDVLGKVSDFSDFYSKFFKLFIK